MVKVLPNTEDTALVTKLVPFQGGLKKRSPEDLDKLQQSLREDGLISPFIVWREGLLLDGHGRLAALLAMSDEDKSILEQQFPIVVVEAETEEEARKAVIQINSQYGKVSKPGLVKFAATIPNYVAPLVTATLGIGKVVKSPIVDHEHVTLKIKVRKDILDKFLAILQEVDGVEVVKK